MRSFEELSDDTTHGDWIPDDVYADWIMEASVCYGFLSGEVTAMSYDMQAGNGQSIQVPYVPARTAQRGTSLNKDCGCLSAASSTVGTYPITVYKGGDYDLLCDFAMWQAKPSFRAAQMKEMAKGLAKFRDDEILDALYAVPTQRQDVGSHGTYVTLAKKCSVYGSRGSNCCATIGNLYDSIVSVAAELRGLAKEPDTVIMSPTVAAKLYMRDYMYPPAMLINYENGRLTSVAGLRVIETCGATSCMASAVTMAIVLDSKRAIGEAWGKRPTFETDRVPECDQTKLVVWEYWGTAVMDQNAVGHIINP